MLISYPFLPVRQASESDDAWETRILNLEMLDSGIYPASLQSAWHGGIHLMDPGGREPVRAIADGTLVAYRLASAKVAPEGVAPEAGVDNSFVLLRHETETAEADSGDGGNKVVFYSLYMHLMNDADVQAEGRNGITRPEPLNSASGNGASAQSIKVDGKTKIYRKSVLGFPGISAGGKRMIHFEIFTTPADLDAFFPANQSGSAASTGTTDGKAGVWGDSYFVIPAGTAVVASAPHTDSHHKIAGHVFPTGVDGTTPARLFVRIGWRRGSKRTTVWRDNGEALAPTLLTDAQGVVDADFEYALFPLAKQLYRSCPSAGYEILRFGRAIGPDKAHLAATEKHLHALITFDAGRRGYIDLASDSISKLSDADFPSWLGWQRIEESDSAFSTDGVCDVPALTALLGSAVKSGDTGDAAKQDFATFIAAPENAAIRERLRRLVCRFHTEWDGADNEQRYARLKQKDGLGPGIDGPFYGKDDDYNRQLAFFRQLQFWSQSADWSNTGLTDPNVWHFHPFGFIQHMRRCGWRSLDEVAQLLPRVSYAGMPARHDRVNISWSNAVSRWTPHVTTFNQAFRKYGVVTPVRQTHFLAQVFIETARMATMQELGRGHRNSRGNWPTRTMEYYQAFYGRGAMQLTWAGNYDDYRDFRTSHALPDNVSGTYVDERITRTSRHYWADPANGGTEKQWYPRYDPDIVATNPYNAADSGGFYWVSKHHDHAYDINSVCDRGISEQSIGRVSVLVNGGGFGFFERQGYAHYIARFLGDDVDIAQTATFSPHHGNVTTAVTVDYTPQRP
jgi:predicted chitinase